MELVDYISFSDSKVDLSENILNEVVLSLNGEFLCQNLRKSIRFIERSKFFDFKLKLGDDEEIKFIVMISNDPVIICVGTNNGSIYFLDKENVYFSVEPMPDHTMTNLRFCSYVKSDLTDGISSLLVQYSPEIVIIPFDSILERINKPESTLNMRKWHIQLDYSDAIINNSSVDKSLIGGLQKFPAVYTISSNQFISCFSVATADVPTITDKITNMAQRFFNWVSGDEKKNDTDTRLKSFYEWSIRDQGRVATSICADPTGRWIAICDNYHRVLIIDSIYGHIIKMLKGLRDAQVVWATNKIFLVYAPFRKVIIACKIPTCENICAIKVETSGRLYQICLNKDSFNIGFVDNKLNTMILNVKYKETPIAKDNESSDVPSCLDLPELLLAENSEAVTLIREGNTDKIYEGIKLVKGEHEAASAVKTLMLTRCQGDILKNSLDMLKEKVSVDVNPEEIWLTERNLMNFIDSKIVFNSYICLYTLWNEVKELNVVNLNLTSIPETELFSYIQSVKKDNFKLSPPTVPELYEFLSYPHKYLDVLFAKVSRGWEKIDLYKIFSALRISRDDFISMFLKWCLFTELENILVGQALIGEFVSDDLVKETFDEFCRNHPKDNILILFQ